MSTVIPTGNKEMKMNTAQQYRESAAKHIQAEQESFERCDTDGFLSQWAHSVSARLDDAKARIVENGNTSVFFGLYDGDRRVAAKIIETQFGSTWLLSDEEANQYGRKFVPIGSKSRVQKQLGLRERKEIAPAWVTLSGKTAVNVRPFIFRTGDKWGSDAVLCQE